ncbi:YolD-like family protein [Staphylococcus gallinarum]|uniref:YolD-like family protein n=1 Tax=Staphylococcus gallinarum TaxID=1293 RepID=A0A3A0VN15_STAGA|nr:YolD-like family protein [Staphylococcus gallinarum]RIP33183.1 YolD-like family protein [Staphylococcus gallinarum]
MIPKEYQYETDYRKIPREFLNPDIPKGRGMVKWAPFATLPEQFEAIQQYITDQNKIDRPLLSDDQLNELNNQLHQALHNDVPVLIEYFQDGWLETVQLRIKRIDLLQMKLVGEITHTTRAMKLSLLDITKIVADTNTSTE